MRLKLFTPSTRRIDDQQFVWDIAPAESEPAHARAWTHLPFFIFMSARIIEAVMLMLLSR